MTPSFLVVCNPHAKRLYDDLLNNYNLLIRPVSNNTEKLTVRLGLKLSQLIDVVIQATNNLPLEYEITNSNNIIPGLKKSNHDHKCVGCAGNQNSLDFFDPFFKPASQSIYCSDFS
jgi:hypothetical protein